MELESDRAVPVFEGLIHAACAPGDMLRSGRQFKGVSMPVEGHECLRQLLKKRGFPALLCQNDGKPANLFFVILTLLRKRSCKPKRRMMSKPRPGGHWNREYASIPQLSNRKGWGSGSRTSTKRPFSRAYTGLQTSCSSIVPQALRPLRLPDEAWLTHANLIFRSNNNCPANNAHRIFSSLPVRWWLLLQWRPQNHPTFPSRERPSRHPGYGWR